ncbi:MAG: RidA family protein [Janthinobacterium lividum]
MIESPEQRMVRLGIELPVAAPAPRSARIVMTRKVGNMLWVSGQLPVWDGNLSYTGKVGSAWTLQGGQQAARMSALNVLAQVRSALPRGLDDVLSVVNLRGFVAVEPDFWKVAEIVNGASDLMIEVFGERGAHTRTAVGVTTMPHNVTVEIEALFEVVV